MDRFERLAARLKAIREIMSETRNFSELSLFCYDDHKRILPAMEAEAKAAIAEFLEPERPCYVITDPWNGATRCDDQDDLAYQLGKRVHVSAHDTPVSELVKTIADLPVGTIAHVEDAQCCVLVANPAWLK